jgi:hypothetical protein
VDLAAGGEAGRLGLVPQRPLEHPSAAEQAAHDRAFGDPGRLGDVGVAEPLDVGQLDRGAELARQLIDGALDGVGAEAVQHRVLDVGDAVTALVAQLVVEEEVLGVLERGFLWSGVLAAVRVDVRVGQNLEQPRAEVAALFEAVIEAVGAHQRVLHQVLGIRRVVGHAQGGAVQRIEVLERLGFEAGSGCGCLP